MKIAIFRSAVVSAGLLALGFWLGAQWGASAGVALNGLRPAWPVTHEEEVTFIRSRVAWPVVPPEWVVGVEANELAWIKDEILARWGLTMVASAGVAYGVRRRLRGEGTGGRSQGTGDIGQGSRPAAADQTYGKTSCAYLPS